MARILEDLARQYLETVSDTGLWPKGADCKAVVGGMVNVVESVAPRVLTRVWDVMYMWVYNLSCSHLPD